MIEPLKDNVIVEPVVNPDLIPGGITLPERSRDALRFGRVAYVGPDVQGLKPGDTVILPTWNDDELEIDGKKYIVLAEKAISVRITE
ncbi:hypothetical protein LCGC14_0783280 [marine sediment metagenome]|uniref:10 kDa chaperonin n=1 Tax=marine sediment metagenome TaxID=412755 RepID=A0A0F9SEQ0_9ZZZZ